MTTTWKELGQAVLTGTPTAIYTAPTLTQAAVHHAQAWNPGASPVVVDVYLIPPAGSATDATHIDRVQVSAASPSPIFGLINAKLGPGYSIYASGAGVTLTVTGVENS